ncbi:hypothetical protein BD779DRAFT_1802391 [Infundibulicybe gibba]|nr:hypothetical protein BD779DRAFT_1802391 [Infundibulicybe gibba]
MTSQLRREITRPSALQLDIQICLPLDEGLPSEEAVSASSIPQSIYYSRYHDQECDDANSDDLCGLLAGCEAESLHHTRPWTCVDYPPNVKSPVIPIVNAHRAQSYTMRLGTDKRDSVSTAPLGPCSSPALGLASGRDVGAPSFGSEGLSFPQAPISFVMHASRGLGNENSWRSKSFQFGSPLSPNPRFRPGASSQAPRSPMAFSWDSDPSLSPSESFDSEDSFPSTPVTPDFLWSPPAHHHFSHPPLPKI